jgi:release factor glutamine methyltransferase
MHVTESSRARLLAHPELLLTPAQLGRYGDLVKDRASGQPLPYLTGEVEFYGLDIEVTPEVLIPRPETEVLVDLALERRPTTVVDVGTGSGCIAVALAVHLPEAAVFAIDISPAALAVARRNAERYGLGERIRFIVGDLLDRRPEPVDLIVSNPPYVSADEWTLLPPSIRDYEPRVALNGGSDGLEVVRRLLSQSQGLLEPGGALLIEIGASQGELAKEAAETFFPENGTSIRIHPDLAGRDRVLEVQT